MYLEKAQVLSSAGERLCVSKPGANNPERLQESQALQLLCELGSLFPANGAGTVFFFTRMALWSPHLKPVLKVENGCGCHRNIP